MSDPARYDGSRPEPPYNTDTDAVALLQEELDTMTGDRDLFAKALAAMTADRDALRARLEITDDHEMPGDRIDHLEFLLESERKECGRLRAELDRTKAELERVRRNHLRRMEHDAIDLTCGPFRFTDRDHARLNRIIEGCRAALERKADA